MKPDPVVNKLTFEQTRPEGLERVHAELDGLGILGLDGRLNRLSTGVDQFSDDDHDVCSGFRVYDSGFMGFEVKGSRLEVAPIP
jgi:hypothetical protein